MIFQKLKLILSSYYVKKNSNAFYDPDGKLCLDFKNFNKIITSVFKKISLQRNFNYQKKILIIRKKFITWKLFYIYNILSFFFCFDEKNTQICKKETWLYIWFTRLKFFSILSSSVYYSRFVKIYYVQIFKEFRFFLQKSKMISLEMNSILLNRYIFQMFRQRKVKKFYKKIFFKMNFSLITYQAKIHFEKDFFIKKTVFEKLQKKKSCFSFFLYVNLISSQILNFKLKSFFLNLKKKAFLDFFLFYEFKKVYYFSTSSEKPISNSLGKFYNLRLNNFLLTIYIDFILFTSKQLDGFILKKQHFWCCARGFYEQGIYFEKKKNIQFICKKLNFFIYNFHFY